MKKQQQTQLLQSEQIKIGRACFKPTIDINLLEAQSVKETLCQQDWQICQSKYGTQNWKLIFKSMISCQVNDLQLDQHANPSLIKQISHIVFSNLSALFLNDNKINNIEALTLLSLQSLEILYISHNQISKLSCFPKLTSPKQLSQLSLYENPISSICSLSRLRFRNQNVFSFVCQTENNKIIQDLSNIMKLETNILNQIWTADNDRIIQLQIRAIIKKKYRLLDFMYQMY